MKLSEMFWNATQTELKQGYIEQENHFICLLCGKATEKGIIYGKDGIFYEAEKFIVKHLEDDHESVFTYLIHLDKKLTGLTDHQNRLLRLFYEGRTDAEIQKELDIGSSSTIRNHRFVLKEKERQAKLFLTMMDLLKEKDKHHPAFIDIHQTARMIDDRYNVTQAEKDEMLQKFFDDGKLTRFPSKEKQRLVILREVLERFQPEKRYKEQEVNDLLSQVYEDYALLRRYLIDYGFIDRTPDGSMYWRKG